MMRKVGDFQKWIEEFRNQMSNETYNKIHIPFLEYAQEDMDLLKQERKKLDSEGASEGDTLSALTTTIRKSDLKSLQKVSYTSLFLNIAHLSSLISFFSCWSSSMYITSTSKWA
jgi:uncharacterized protein YegL